MIFLKKVTQNKQFYGGSYNLTKKRKYGLAGIVCLTIIVGGCGLANGENRDVNRETNRETTVEQAEKTPLPAVEETQTEQPMSQT